MKRVFETGASRDTVDGKLDYEGFLSPLVLRAFAEYMHKHREMRDGSLRPSDNWQQGMPADVYMSSAWRHFMDWWTIHRGHEARDRDGEVVDQIEAILALIFNAQGYLHDLLARRP